MNNIWLTGFVAMSLALQGCLPTLLVSGATTTGVVVAQERSVGNAVDDAGIRLALNNLFLQKDINDLFRNVNIRVQEGRVMLTGSVDKPETSVEAVRLAWKPKGVKEVMNEIQVNDKSGVTDYARDAWINAQIRSKLLFEKGVQSVNYNVETVNNVVYIMGIAQNQDELSKVTYLASTTSYVKEVISHVVMRDDPRRSK